ncbi:MAG TPA: hypothetical protein VJQ82_13120 [Terriglobales bacterium]|nr:hypothetical protein [Terriglobales bacterium]
MKRISYLCLAGWIFLVLGVTLAAAQSSDSLGDYARAHRKGKSPTAKQFDNDNLPKSDKLSVVGQQPASDDKAPAQPDKPADDTQKAPDSNLAKADAPAKTETAAAKAGDDANDEAAQRQKMQDEWKNKISAQKDKIDLLNRELDVLQREYRLRAAAMYADAGNRLRNSTSWDQEDAKYKQQIDDKQKAVDAAKQQLDDMQEQERKAGIR